MIHIKEAKFITSAVTPNQYPNEVFPEIALVGRSNVGKSSLINALLNRRNLARTSNQPGRTQTINFYLVNDNWYFVDLPGYGYAKVSKTTRDSWKRFIEKYLSRRVSLKAIWQLVDVRHPPSDQDRQMWQWISASPLLKLVIATKLDKISKSQRTKHIIEIRKSLNIEQEKIVPFSTKTGEGKRELIEWIENNLGQEYHLSESSWEMD